MKWILILFLILSFIACDDKVEEKVCTDNCEYVGKIKCEVDMLKTCQLQSDGCLGLVDLKKCDTQCDEGNNQCKSLDGCNAGEHKENEECLSNTKQVPCKDIAPENGVSKVIDVDIIWDFVTNSWKEPVECKWECKPEFHTEDNISCIGNIRQVPCKDTAPENGTSEVIDVDVTWDFEINSWKEPIECKWACKEGYYQNAESCIENGHCRPECKDKAHCNLDNKCECDAGYEGDPSACTDINECATNPCQNGGGCIDGINSYSCECLAGFKGDNCETNIDDCATNPCQNGGDCIDGINSYSCSCSAGYEGINCETDIDECSDDNLNDCDENATCENILGSYNCECKSGYTGDGKSCKDKCLDMNCDDDNSCTKNECHAGECNFSNFVDNDTNCDDNNLCTEDDKCHAGICVGTIKACDDGLSCTTNICEESSGDCILIINQGNCLINDNGVDICYEDGESNSTNNCLICDTFTNQEEWSIAQMGTECNDSNGCTQNDKCDRGGICVGEFVECGESNGVEKECIEGDDDTFSCVCNVPYSTDSNNECILECSNPSCGLNSTCSIIDDDTGCICDDETFDFTRDGNCCPKYNYYDVILDSCLEACNDNADILTKMTNNDSSTRAVVILETGNIIDLNGLNNLTANIDNCGALVNDWYKITLKAGTYATIKIETGYRNDAVLELFDNNLNYKAAVDFYSNGTESMIIGGAGTFYIKISDFIPDGDSISFLEYSLNVQIKETTINDNFLYIYGGEKSWSDGAKQYCERHGSKLVKIDNSEENRIIKEFITDDTWIGLNDKDDEAGCEKSSSNWKWTDNTNTIYKNWESNNPDGCHWNWEEDCVMMIDDTGKWADRSCGAEKRFICEYSF